LENKVFDIIDARCNHDVHVLPYSQQRITRPILSHLIPIDVKKNWFHFEAPWRISWHCWKLLA